MPVPSWRRLTAAAVLCLVAPAAAQAQAPAPTAIAMELRESPAVVDVGQPVQLLAGFPFAFGSTPVPTGTMTLRVFGPGDAGCTGTPLLDRVVPIETDYVFPGNTDYGTSVTIDPTQRGVYRATAAYAGDAAFAASSTPCRTVLTVQGPSVGAETLALAFPGEAPEGTITRPLDAVVRNDGDGGMSLGVRDVRLAGRDRDDFLLAEDRCTEPRSTVLPGTTCTVRVRFAPSGPGPRAAVLEVLSADAEGDVLRIPLTGTGAARAAAGAGADGAAGTAGRDGAPGAPGADGADGATGLPGTPGRDGAAGVPGAPGATAPAPTVTTAGTVRRGAITLLCSSAEATCRLAVRPPRGFTFASARVLDARGRLRAVARSRTSGNVLRDARGRTVRLPNGAYEVRLTLRRRGRPVVRTYTVEVRATR